MSERHIITRSLEFDSGHRVLGHEGKCRYIHGHRYKAEITVESDRLDDCGRVLDFGKIKELVGGWIDKNWDHNLILHYDDPLITNGTYDHPTDKATGIIRDILGRLPFIMPSAYPNPTAENLVAVLAYAAREILLPYDLEVTHVRLWETPNSRADWYAPK